MGTLKTKTKQVYISRSLCLLDLKTRVCVSTQGPGAILLEGYYWLGRLQLFYVVLLFYILIFWNEYSFPFLTHISDILIYSGILTWVRDRMAPWLSARSASASASWVSFVPLKEALFWGIGDNKGQRWGFQVLFLSLDQSQATESSSRQFNSLDP